MSNSRRSVILGAGPGEEGKDTRKNAIYSCFIPPAHTSFFPLIPMQLNIASLVGMSQMGRGWNGSVTLICHWPPPNLRRRQS